MLTSQHVLLDMIITQKVQELCKCKFLSVDYVQVFVDIQEIPRVVYWSEVID